MRLVSGQQQDLLWISVVRMELKLKWYIQVKQAGCKVVNTVLFLMLPLNDFVSGEIERAILECVDKSRPDLILIEGQSSLLNPSGPCGSEIILSGNAKGIILMHDPGRECFIGLEGCGCKISSLENGN